jgi:hypothetical protein
LAPSLPGAPVALLRLEWNVDRSGTADGGTANSGTAKSGTAYGGTAKSGTAYSGTADGVRDMTLALFCGSCTPKTNPRNRLARTICTEKGVSCI